MTAAETAYDDFSFTFYPIDEPRCCGPTRYILARLCLIPLSLVSGGCLVLSIAAVPLSSRSPPSIVAAEALSMVVYVLLTFWLVLQAATISHDHLVIHEVRVWAYSWPPILLVHATFFLTWSLLTRPTAACPPMPACEYTLGGICSPSDLAIYSQLLVCEVNWGLFAAGLSVLLLQGVVLLVVLLMRILPALQNPKRGMWYASVYEDHDVHWRFEPWQQLPKLPLLSRCMRGIRASKKSDAEMEMELARMPMPELRVNLDEDTVGKGDMPLPTGSTYESFGSRVPPALPSGWKSMSTRKGKERDPLSIFF